jgi:hypothetical protein
MLFNRSLLNVLLVTLVVLLSTRDSAGQLNDLPADCDSGIEHTTKCIRAAEAAARATGCNWYRIIGPLNDCIKEAVAGCYVDEQEVWYDYVKSFNRTMTTDDCYPSCVNQEERGERMFRCFSDANFGQLVDDIHWTVDLETTGTSCRDLNTMNTCLLSATYDCPALTDVSHDRIYSTPYSAEAYTRCGIASFQAATTSAPVALLDTNSMMMDPDSTTRSPGALDGGETLLVILGSIVIIATVIVILIFIIVAIRKRRAADRRSLMGNWRPNGHKMYLDDPQFIPAQSGNLYRPIAISHNKGYIDEGHHVQ